MRAGAFTDLRVIRLINRRFIPFYFNTGGPGLGRDDEANQFVDGLARDHEEFARLRIITDPYGTTSNTVAYFGAFSTKDDGKLLGLAGGWKNEKEAHDLERLYPSKDEVFEVLLKVLKDNPDYNKFSTQEQRAIDRAKAQPYDPVALADAAIILEDLGQYDEATKLYREAIANTDSKDPETRESRARIFCALLRIARYQKDWQQQEKLLEQIGWARLGRGAGIEADIAMEQGYRLLAEKQYESALEKLTTAIDQYPESKRMGELHFYAGVANFFLEDKPSAYYHWCWIVENIPEDHLSRRAYIAAAHEDFPYPNFELGGFRTSNSIGTHSIIAAYANAKKHYVSHVAATPTSKRPVFVLTGATSAVKEREFIRVTDETSMNKIWHRHYGMTEMEAFQNRLEEFKVDFDEHEVLVIFNGATTNQRSLMIMDMVEDEKTLKIQYDLWGYQTSGGFDESSVYAFVLIPKSSKEIVLEENIQGLKDHPPKWKHRARLDAQSEE